MTRLFARPRAAFVISLALAMASHGSSAQPSEPLPGAPPMPPKLQAKLAAALAERGADYVPRTHNKQADGSPIYTNRLILETSPYLNQHAHNPVNWHPWGDEAFETAKRLGIGKTSPVFSTTDIRCSDN